MKIKEKINNFKNKGEIKEIKEVPGCLHESGGETPRRKPYASAHFLAVVS